jgi:DNA-directed RNA polymerase I, II, and III subunit RPABC2
MSKKLHDEMEEFAVSDEELEKNITEDEDDDDTEYNEEESEIGESDIEDDNNEEGAEGVMEGAEGEGVNDDEGEGSENEYEDDEGEKKKNAKKVANAKNKGKLNAAQSGMIGIPHGLEHSDSSDDSESDDEYTTSNNNNGYFQKLDKNIRKNYIAEYHPEVLIHNYDEIMNMARVVRDKNGVIVDELHRTIPIMTKYERTRILGQRTKQLNEGAKPMIKVDSTVIDGYLIALKELEQKRIPFIIRRPLPNGGSEYWRVQDLEIL